MRIGVDARILSEELTGIGRYTLFLLKEMISEKHEWFFYSHRPLVYDFSHYSNVTLKIHSFQTRTLRMIWSQTVLPLWAKRHGLDLFWSPAHRLPLLIGHDVRTVITIHDLVWRHAPETMRKLSRLLDAILMPRTIMMADGVIAVSKHTEHDIIEELPNVEKKKIRVIYEGVSLRQHLSCEHLRRLGIDSPYLLFVGTLEPRKNLRRLILAYKRVGSDLRKSYQLVIAGGKGWGSENIPQIIKEFGLIGEVLILGYVSEEYLATLYKHATYLVMPSLFEGFGLPLVEAMSYGTPVLTSNASSMKEIAGDAAILVNPFDVDSITVGLKIALQDKKLQRKLSKNGLRRAANFSWQKAAKETLSFFEGVCIDS